MAGRDEIAAVHEDTRLIEDALAYVTALYRELSQENGAPMLGTQNQVVDFILDDAELRNYVRALGSRRQARRGLSRPARAPAVRS